VKGLRTSDFGLRTLALWLFAARCTFAAATNTPASDEIPPLRPPHAELPPGFWEQHTSLAVFLGLLLVILVGVGIWLLTRPKPVIVVPPEVGARAALGLLRDRPEDGLLLSRVSQVLCHYVTAAFGLPPGELTTAEFRRAVAGCASIGPDLAAALSDFLRQCDERKFSPPAPAPPLSAVDYASKLIDQSQARRASVSSSPAS
jgi:hypothetical protein